MLRLHIQSYGTPSARKIDQAVQILHRGGVAAYPTDSVYALGCAIDSRKAIERIYRARQMHKNRRLAVMCPDLSAASEYGHFSQTGFRLAQRVFPGPYTLVVPATRNVPKMLLDSRARTVGIRIPDHPVVNALIAGLGRPLLNTSAVPPEEDDALDHADDIADTFGNAIDVLIDSECPGAAPSTVLQIDGDEITVIREGMGSLDGIV
jgi:tRNA threonylcarbamoyl adenosine modification protein (Sua5/YciO/YrdC/YwlC family)